MKFLKKKRHSSTCPCREDIKTQTQFYSKLLKKVSRGSKNTRNLLLEQCDPCFIRYLGHCATGILFSNIQLHKDRYGGLKGTKKFMLRLINPKISVEKKNGNI